MLVIPVQFISCDSLRYVTAGNTVDATFKRTSRLVDPKTDREVILVPMGHVGSEKGYARVKKYLDQLKADGFVCYIEGLVSAPYSIDIESEITYPQLRALVRSHARTQSDSLRLDTLERKLRRLVGVATSEGYTNPDNKSVPARYRNGRKVAQNKERVGTVTERDIWVDYSLSDLMNLYEAHYGEVPLTEYDFQTPLNAKYKDKFHRGIYGIARLFRDSLLLQRVLESPHPKIAVVFGYGHTHNLKRELHYLNGYVVDKKYKVPKR